MTKKKRILITGSTGGIGSAIAGELANNPDYELVLHFNSSQEKARQLQQKFASMGCPASTLGFNVGDREAAKKALEKDIEENGAYWGIIHSAGTKKDAAFPALENEDWDNVINTDLNSFYNVIHPCVMPMIRLRSGGRIVVISSVSGMTGNRGQVNYSAAKAGLIGASKALAVELASRKITVNCVAPGLIDTDMIDMDPRAIEHAMKLIPMQRMGKPEEVAGLVSYLLSNSAAYVTRQVISVNGGMI
ncbi:3-ketoacyl-ACP reductase FabG2 [uncultured Turicimonas sp.]|uniref:3-ketoacyl-ACP reductase FabG2 n=1 Tax=uncultured Turicimonas sp. TaxID=1918607 RepID=UPI0028049977|nr:3-ketoacyl-ACP reductase FabG2 [uncultured Turicimonas sp.]